MEARTQMGATRTESVHAWCRPMQRGSAESGVRGRTKGGGGEAAEGAAERLMCSAPAHKTSPESLTSL